MNEFPKRKHPRLRGYDYSRNGAYFLTFCVKDKNELLGRIAVGRGILDAPFMQLSEHGRTLTEAIEFLNKKANAVAIEKYVIMPNHVHLIATIDNWSNGASRMSRPTDARVPRLISSIKRFTNKKAGFNLWQRTYHDHIIRSEGDYLRIWQYIDQNPARWFEDCYYVKSAQDTLL